MMDCILVLCIVVLYILHHIDTQIPLLHVLGAIQVPLLHVALHTGVVQYSPIYPLSH